MKRRRLGWILNCCSMLLAASGRAAEPLHSGDILIGLADTYPAVVNLTTGETRVLASSDHFASVYGVAAEASGSVLVLGFDCTSGAPCVLRIFRVDPVTGAVSVVADLAPEPPIGPPFSFVLEPGGGSILYMPSRHLYRVDLATGISSIVASIPETSNGVSYGIARARDGTIFMSDAAAHKLWRANLVTGEVTLVASGLGFGGFYRAHGIAVDADGFVIGVHHDPGQILRVDPATGEQTLVASGGELKYLTEIEIDRDGSLLVSDLFDGVIVRVDPTTGAQQTIDVPYIITGLALVPWPRCSNGLDDDGDGAIDFDGGILAGLPPARRTSPDSQCIVHGVGDPLHDREEPAPIACGLGWEIAPLVALARAGFRRRGRVRQPQKADIP